MNLGAEQRSWSINDVEKSTLHMPKREDLSSDKQETE